MENQKRCQSCGMLLNAPEEFGTEKDGSKNQAYCSYCYQNGKFEDENMTLEQMIETCVPFVVEAGDAKSPEEAQALLQEYMPQLKRWAKA